MDPAPLVFLFDIDGTLIDSSGAGGGALLIALQAEFSLPQVCPVTLHGRTDLGIMTELLETHGVEPTTAAIEQLCRHYFRLLPEMLAECPGRVLPGVVEILEAVTGNSNCHVGVLTGNMQISATAKLEHYGLHHFFEFGIYGDSATTRPALSQPALQVVNAHTKQDFASERILVIGDTPLDIALAKAMGARSLAVCTGGIDAASLAAAGADCVVEDLSDTAQIIDWCLQCSPINNK